MMFCGKEPVVGEIRNFAMLIYLYLVPRTALICACVTLVNDIGIILFVSVEDTAATHQSEIEFGTVPRTEHALLAPAPECYSE